MHKNKIEEFEGPRGDRLWAAVETETIVGQKHPVLHSITGYIVSREKAARESFQHLSVYCQNERDVFVATDFQRIEIAYFRKEDSSLTFEEDLRK